MLSKTPNPNPAAAPKAAPYLRVGNIRGIAYTTANMHMALQVSSTTGIRITKAIQGAPAKAGKIARFMAIAIRIPKKAAETSATRNPITGSISFLN